MKDLIQEVHGKLAKPEIRVWCHPHKIGKSGDDYYYTFKKIGEAKSFIKKHKEAEDKICIAYDGKELLLSCFKNSYPKVNI